MWGYCDNIFDDALPFADTKQSGSGRKIGAGAMEFYTETKAICIQL